MMEAIINSIKSGNFSDKELLQQKEGVERLMQTEAYKDYGAPYTLYLWKKVLF